MIQNLTKLLDLLLDYRSVLNGNENKDKRATCIANILKFYKEDIYKKELYVKYIYKLYDLHVQADNHVETGFTLKLHADLFSWSFSPVQEFTIHNENQISVQNNLDKLEWQRKEQLYLRMIDCFDKGKCWEEAIPLIKELETFYDRHFEYQKLSVVIKKRAHFYDQILTQFRLEPEYFRVVFYGLGFPPFLRNKLFVYKGHEYEKIGDFIQRLRDEFPEAEIMMKNNPPDDDILQSSAQYIQVCTVKPIPEISPEFESQQNLNEKILDYYLLNQVRKFTFDRPLPKDPVDKENEFKSLWIERTNLITVKRLPSILRSAEVIERQVIELSPVEHACDVIETMSKELKKLIVPYSVDPSRQLTPLTMRLQGVIEAAVNGGLSKYQEAFFDPKYIENNMNYYSHIKRLKKLIFTQIHILEGGLSVHKRLVPASLQPLHALLVERFSSMKQSFISASSYIVDIGPSDKRPSIVNTPLPPIPQHSRIRSLTNGSSQQDVSRPGSQNGENGGRTDDAIYSILNYEKNIQSPPIPKRSSIPSASTPPPPPPSLTRPRSSGVNQSDTSCSPYSNGVLSPSSNTMGRLVHVIPIHDGGNLSQRSRSMPRNGMNPPSDTNHPPLPPRHSRGSIDTTDTSQVDGDRPVLPKRTVRTQLESSLITVESDSIGNRVAGSPPPLPMKKRIPTSMSTTIITLGSSESDAKNGSLFAQLPSQLPTPSLFSNAFLNANGQLINGSLLGNDTLKSNGSSVSTLSISTSSSSTNEFSFSETHVLNGASTLSSFSSSQSSRSESLQQHLQQLNLDSNS
jgi:hypothetical protein